ncbi:helix-turn-helix transcriptional regulator [Paenibacillus sp. FSL R10-2796]|uniref:helix-turn-helix domain-containing protein n=1 Tax=Paenibacillus sp. FSL R10-2796 TaxID=2954663 RepID=UPI0030DB4C7E
MSFMSFGVILQTLRNKREIGVNELARISGVPGSYISNLERGKKENPSTAVTSKLIRALGYTEEDLTKIMAVLATSGENSLDVDDQLERVLTDMKRANPIVINEDEGELLQKLCLSPITRTLFQNSQYLSREDFIFISRNIEDLVKHLAERNKNDQATQISREED